MTSRALGVRSMTPLVDLLEFSFVWPDKLLSANDRLHWGQRSVRVKHWREAAGWIGLATKNARKLRLPLAPSYVACTFIGARQRDPGNLAPCQKAILDGLTKGAKFWPDDDATWVTEVSPQIRKASKVLNDHGTVVVSIWPR